MVIGRYFKVHKHYVLIHGLMTTGIIFCSFFVEIAMSYTESELFSWNNFHLSTVKDQMHLVLGTLFTILMFMQLAGGWVLKYFLEGD